MSEDHGKISDEQMRTDLAEECARLQAEICRLRAENERLAQELAAEKTLTDWQDKQIKKEEIRLTDRWQRLGHIE